MYTGIIITDVYRNQILLKVFTLGNNAITLHIVHLPFDEFCRMPLRELETPLRGFER